MEGEKKKACSCFKVGISSWGEVQSLLHFHSDFFIACQSLATTASQLLSHTVGSRGMSHLCLEGVVPLGSRGVPHACVLGQFYSRRGLIVPTLGTDFGVYVCVHARVYKLHTLLELWFPSWNCLPSKYLEKKKKKKEAARKRTPNLKMFLFQQIKIARGSPTDLRFIASNTRRITVCIAVIVFSVTSAFS